MQGFLHFGRFSTVNQIRSANDSRAAHAGVTVDQDSVTLLNIHVNLLADHKNLGVGCDGEVFPVVVEVRDTSIVEFIRVVAEPDFIRNKSVTAGGMLPRLFKIENGCNL